MIQECGVGAGAKSNADGMVARKIDDEDMFGFCAHRADVFGMR
jgi:hypothetical protein